MREKVIMNKLFEISHIKRMGQVCKRSNFCDIILK